MLDGEDPSLTLRTCRFNQQQDLFISANAEGFVIYQSQPFRERVKRPFEGGLWHAELLNRSNLIAIVTRDEPTRVQIWDDISQRIQLSLECTDTQVVAIRFFKDILVVVGRTSFNIYQTGDNFVLLNEVNTSDNVHGLIEVFSANHCIIAVPAQRCGSLQILHYRRSSSAAAAVVSSLEYNKRIVVASHTSDLRCLAMSPDGSLIATASQTGTLIRIWNTSDGQQVFELRRGLDSVDIQSMSFSHLTEVGNLKLAVISNRATAHIFALDPRIHSNKGKDQFVLLPLVYAGVSYFSSHGKVGQARIRDPSSSRRTFQDNKHRQFMIAWVEPQVFIVVSLDGCFWKYVLPDQPVAGDSFVCHQEAFRRWE